MGVDIATYRARIGLYGRRKGNVTLNCESVNKVSITSMWFLGLIIASLLIMGGVELNPALEILVGQRENEKTVNDWMKKNKTSMDNVCMKLDKLNEIMMKMQEEHERFGGLVNPWEAKQKVMKPNCDLMDEWRRRKNILIFGIEEYPHETYFDTLKTKEDILKTEEKVETADWHIEKVHRLGRLRRDRLILVSFTSFSKKIEVLQAK
jgi:hypothetical protein